MWSFKEGVRWVVNRALEGSGKGGWISRGFVGVCGGREGGLGGVGEEGAAGVEGGGRVVGSLLLAAGSSGGGEEGTCIRGLFAWGGEWRVGDGELDWSGRLRCGEFAISDTLFDEAFGWESGMVLGGVCHESD